MPTAADFSNLSAADQAPYLQFHGANAAADWARDAGSAVQAYQAAHPQATTPAMLPGAPGGQGQQTLAGAQQQATLSGQYNGAPTEAARQFNATTGLAYLTQAAQLGGPASYYQSAAFNRGAQQAGQTPAFLTALSNNTGMPVFNGSGGAGAAPGVQSMGTLGAGLTGSGQPTGDQGLSAIGKIGAAGGQALSPQAWENMNPDEQALFTSGMKASGYSMPAFLQAYSSSRVGQSAAQAS